MILTFQGILSILVIHTIQRSYPLKRPSPEMREVLFALGLQSKNIRNRALFFVRNVLSAFDDGKMKTELHENVISAIEATERQIAKINAKRTNRAKVKSEKNEQNR